MELRNIVKHYGELHVFDGVNFSVDRGDRIAFVGVNGAGKSTLARIIAGVEPFDSGERLPGHNVTVSYFAQHQAEELDPAFDVLQTVEAVATGDIRTRLRSLLGSFLFSGDDVFKKVSVLSGGEKSRLALAKMLLMPSNLIVLDEPTNHLDMRSKTVLQEALAEFEGSLIVVSHDRDFLDPLVTKVVEFKSGSIRTYLGSVSDYLAARNKDEAQRLPLRCGNRTSTQSRYRSVTGNAAKRRSGRNGTRRSSPLQKRWTSSRRTSPTGKQKRQSSKRSWPIRRRYKGPDKIREVNTAYSTVGEKLQDLYHEWGKVSEELERLMAQYDAEMARR